MKKKKKNRIILEALPWQPTKTEKYILLLIYFYKIGINKSYIETKQ